MDTLLAAARIGGGDVPLDSLLAVGGSDWPDRQQDRGRRRRSGPSGLAA